MANIDDDMEPTRKRNVFESAVAYLLPNEPVVKLRTTNKYEATYISDTTDEVSSFGNKAGIGKKGVHLRYHKPKEYAKISESQMDELFEWRKA